MNAIQRMHEMARAESLRMNGVPASQIRAGTYPKQRKTMPNQKRDEVLAYVRKAGPVTGFDVADAVCLTYGSAAKHLYRLWNEGLLTRKENAARTFEYSSAEATR